MSIEPSQVLGASSPPAAAWIIYALMLGLFAATPLLWRWIRPGGPARRQWVMGESAVVLAALLFLSLAIAGFALMLLAGTVFKGVSPEKRALVALGPAEVVMFGVMLVINGLARPRGTHRLGLERAGVGRGIFSGMATFALTLPWVLVASLLVSWVVTRWHLDAPLQHDIFRLWRSEPEGWTLFKVMTFFSAVIAAPLAEELVFRGFLQTLLLRLSGKVWVAVAVTSVLFAWSHGAWTMQVPIFILAMGLGLAYERHGNLWTCILAHLMFNAVQFGLFLLQL